MLPDHLVVSSKPSETQRTQNMFYTNTPQQHIQLAISIYTSTLYGTTFEPSSEWSLEFKFHQNSYWCGQQNVSGFVEVIRPR
jgi:hypothetical protein